MSFEVVSELPEKLGIVLSVTEKEVARSAQPVSHLSGVVCVVDAGCLGSAYTDNAQGLNFIHR